MIKSTLMQSIIVIAISLLISITASITTATAGLPILNIDIKTGTTKSQMPDYYPASFQLTGTIFSIGTSSIIITGSSERYSLSPNLLVHSMATEFTPRNALRAGDEVGFSFSKGMDNKRIITEIWVLPSGTLSLG